MVSFERMSLRDYNLKTGVSNIRWELFRNSSFFFNSTEIICLFKGNYWLYHVFFSIVLGPVFFWFLKWHSCFIIKNEWEFFV